MVAAERGIWKSTELRRQLADAGLEISAGKMSGLWTGTPTTIRLEDLDVAWLKGAKKVGVTSGASTPSQLTRRVIEYIEALEPPE